ncbi:MAG: endonuclease MutS2 [Ruminococcaceae bacterium]|nr:endonuclease MutS2 [Oscillospiraceae bacterium]
MNSRKRDYKALELEKVLEMLAMHTVCPDAKDIALSLKPESSLEMAQSLLNQTQSAHMMLARFGGPAFGGLKNVNNALSRADAGSTLNMKELLDIASVLHVIRSIVTWRSTNSGVETVLDVYFDALSPNKFLEDAITSAIISEDEMSDNASPLLQTIRRKIRNQESNIREKLDKLIRSSGNQKFLQENIITMRNGRFVVPVKNEHRSEIPGLVHDTSSSGATVFIEPAAVVEANNEIKVLQSQERDEIDRILSELSAQCGDFANSIKNSYECAVELNVIFAKAQLAYRMNASVPILNDEGIIDLKNARHPLISKDKVVPVNIRLGDDFDTLVITGPNTGGKTVSIKTLGLMSMMAMCGLMLPVSDESRVSVFENVLADIGDEQSIEQSLSTFSAHMTNIIEILKIAGEKSLVLIDELGAGTDPVEGAALATAILERLHINGAKVGATTHYAELKSYAVETARVENGSCEFDVATLRPTYKLLIGVPGKSNAFAISERLGMGKDIVERAKELVDTESTRFEAVYDKLETTRKAMEEEKQKAETALKEAERLKAEAIKQKEDISSIREKEIEKARNEAVKIVDGARRESYALLAEIDALKKEQKKTKDAADLARRARSAVKKGMEALDSAADPVMNLAEDDDYVLPRELKIGDNVIIASLAKQAEVTSLPDKKGEVGVVAGAIKTRVHISDLRLVEKQVQKKQTPKRTGSSNFEARSTAKAETKVDLRGMNADEAIMTLDRYIDTAYRLSITEFTVVHGKGTGVLRSVVQQYLKGNNFIKSYRLGVYGEGENGVTIVTLK